MIEVSEQQAMNWYWAEVREQEKVKDLRVPQELREPPPSWLELPEGRREEIRRRVALVLDNEIPKSQMGPGDLAIFHGRYRMLDKGPPEHFLDEIKNRYSSSDRRFSSRDLLRKVYWDCLQFQEHCVPNSVRLFGNARVGNFNLTNLQVAGQMVGGQTAYVFGWHLTVANEPELMHDMEKLFSNSIATLFTGDMPQSSRRLVDLWREPQPLSVEIPERQCFHVRIELYDKPFEAFCKKIFSSNRDQERDPFRLWINLECWEMRDVY